MKARTPLLHGTEARDSVYGQQLTGQLNWHIASSSGDGLSPSEVAVNIAYHDPEMLCISGAHRLVDQGSPDLGSGLKITRDSV